MENLERSCRAQCKGYNLELCKYSRATRKCYNDRCFRIHRKAARHMQTPPATQEPSATPRTTNQKQAIITMQNLAYNRPPPLLTLPTQHTTSTHPALSPTHYHTTPSHYAISHHPSDYGSTVPQSPTTTFNPFIRLKHLHSHPKHTILLFPESSSHLNPTPHTSMPRMGTSERHNGAQLLLFDVSRIIVQYPTNRNPAQSLQ